MIDAPGAAFTLRLAREHELQTLVDIDDAASELYAQAGLSLSLARDHPYVLAESRRWRAAIANGTALIAADRDDRPLGFAALGVVDGEPYLDQLSVHPHAMRRGIGKALLHHAIATSGARRLWLTTYAHLPWNLPFYRRHGFVPAPVETCGLGILALLAEQRAALPHPEQRIALVRAP